MIGAEVDRVLRPGLQACAPHTVGGRRGGDRRFVEQAGDVYVRASLVRWAVNGKRGTVGGVPTDWSVIWGEVQVNVWRFAIFL